MVKIKDLKRYLAQEKGCAYCQPNLREIPVDMRIISSATGRIKPRKICKQCFNLFFKSLPLEKI